MIPIETIGHANPNIYRNLDELQELLCIIYKTRKGFYSDAFIVEKIISLNVIFERN